MGQAFAAVSVSIPQPTHSTVEGVAKYAPPAPPAPVVLAPVLAGQPYVEAHVSTPKRACSTVEDAESPVPADKSAPTVSVRAPPALFNAVEPVSTPTLT